MKQRHAALAIHVGIVILLGMEVLPFRKITSVRHSRVALDILLQLNSHTTENNTIRSAKFYSSSNTLYGHALIENNRNAKPRPHF